MDKPLKREPPYAIAGVDRALRVAAMLQLEGELTMSEIADRLGVARSTAHRLLAMLVYRDFAVQTDDRSYRAGPVLELATHSQSRVSALRTAALPQLRKLVDLVEETANLTIRTGAMVRFIASVECAQVLRVGSREGMVFPAHRTTAGLLLLAELSRAELAAVYAESRQSDDIEGQTDFKRLPTDLARVRRNGFAVNRERSERGLVAVGVPVRDAAGVAHAGLSVSMPGVRYEPRRLADLVATLMAAARATESELDLKS